MIRSDAQACRESTSDVSVRCNTTCKSNDGWHRASKPLRQNNMMDQLLVMLPCWATCILFLQNDINLKSKHDGEDCLCTTAQLPPLVINVLSSTEVARP